MSIFRSDPDSQCIFNLLALSEWETNVNGNAGETNTDVKIVETHLWDNIKNRFDAWNYFIFTEI